MLFYANSLFIPPPYTIPSPLHGEESFVLAIWCQMHHFNEGNKVPKISKQYSQKMSIITAPVILME